MNDVIKFILVWLALMGVYFLALVWAHGANVMLAWDRNPEPDILEYRLYLNQNWDRSRSTTSNVYTVSNVCGGVEYCFNVTAVNTAWLQSDPSETLCWRAPVRTNRAVTLAVYGDPAGTNAMVCQSWEMQIYPERGDYFWVRDGWLMHGELESGAPRPIVQVPAAERVWLRIEL